MREEESKYLFEITQQTVDTAKYGKIDKKVFYQVHRVILKIGYLKAILKVMNIPYNIDINIGDIDNISETEKEFFMDALAGKSQGYGKDAGEIFKKAYSNHSEEM